MSPRTSHRAVAVRAEDQSHPSTLAAVPAMDREGHATLSRAAGVQREGRGSAADGRGASRLPPGWNVEGVLRQLQPGAVRQHLEEVWVQEVASQTPGCSLVSIMRGLPCMLVLLFGLLAVRLVDDEGEQARGRGQDVTNVRLVGPLPTRSH